MEFLLGLWTLLVQFANKREANLGLEQKNNLKTTYTPLAAIMVGCVSCATKEQGVPMRQHRLVHMGSQSKDSVWGHVTCTWAFCKVMREHHNGSDGH